MKKFVLLTTLLFTVFHGWAAKPFETSQWQTKNGARVVFYQAMEVPMLDISIAFAAGSAYDGENFGLSSLTTRLLNQGNGGFDANVLAEKLADTGAQFEAGSNQDMIFLNLKTLVDANNLRKSSEVFSLIINNPDFPLDSFIREKNQQLVAIAQAKESPDEVANEIFFQTLYKKHPYGHPVVGNRDSIKKLKAEQIRHFYQQFFVSSNAVIVLVGAIDKTTAEGLAEQIIKGLPKGKPASEIPTAQPLAEETNLEIPFPSSQTILRLGQLGITHHDENYFPLLVGNYILGGGALVSKLVDELRVKRGLTYGVTSRFFPMPGKGPFLIGLSTKNSQARTAIDLTRETLVSFLKVEPDANALLAAKRYLIGSFPLSLASNRSIADMLLKIAFYNLPNDYLNKYVSHIDEVTAEKIKQSFEELISANTLLQISVGRN